MQRKPLPFWFAYARGLLFFFLALMALNWGAYLIARSWVDWWGVLALASVLPGVGLMITWDKM